MKDEIKTKFFRQNYFRHKKLGMKWRRPRGKQSKMRKSKKGKSPMPNIGYKTSDSTRGLVHGYRPVFVSNAEDLKKIKQNEIAVISSGVGLKKILDISKKVDELNVKIYNSNKVRKSLRHFAKIEKKRRLRMTPVQSDAKRQRETASSDDEKMKHAKGAEKIEVHRKKTENVEAPVTKAEKEQKK